MNKMGSFFFQLFFVWHLMERVQISLKRVYYYVKLSSRTHIFTYMLSKARVRAEPKYGNFRMWSKHIFLSYGLDLKIFILYFIILPIFNVFYNF